MPHYVASQGICLQTVLQIAEWQTGGFVWLAGWLFAIRAAGQYLSVEILSLWLLVRGCSEAVWQGNLPDSGTNKLFAGAGAGGSGDTDSGYEDKGRDAGQIRLVMLLIQFHPMAGPDFFSSLDNHCCRLA